MKALDFYKVNIREAFDVRIAEADALLEQMETTLRKLNNQHKRDGVAGNQTLDWADFGSLTHAVEQLEKAANTLSVNVVE